MLGFFHRMSFAVNYPPRIFFPSLQFSWTVLSAVSSEMFRRRAVTPRASVHSNTGICTTQNFRPLCTFFAIPVAACRPQFSPGYRRYFAIFVNVPLTLNLFCTPVSAGDELHRYNTLLSAKQNHNAFFDIWPCLQLVCQLSTNCTTMQHAYNALSWLYGDRGGTVIKVLCYKSEGRWFDSNWCHWNPSDRNMALGST